MDKKDNLNDHSLLVHAISALRLQWSLASPTSLRHCGGEMGPYAALPGIRSRQAAYVRTEVFRTFERRHFCVRKHERQNCAGEY